MIWLMGQMWLLLFLAFGIGVGCGFWIWGKKNNHPQLQPKPETPMGTLDSELPIQQE